MKRIIGQILTGLLLVIPTVASADLPETGRWKPNAFWSANADPATNAVLISDSSWGWRNGGHLWPLDNNNYDEPHLAFQSYAGHCGAADEIFCIEELGILDAEGQPTSFSEDEILLGDELKHQGADGYEIPPSGNFPVWKTVDDEGKATQVSVIASLSGAYLPRANQYPPNQLLLDIELLHLAGESEDIAAEERQTCALSVSNPAQCYSGFELDKEQSISISIRLPKYVGGWFLARIDDFNVDLQKSTDTHNVWRFAGKPMELSSLEYVYEWSGREEFTKALFPYALANGTPEGTRYSWQGWTQPAMTSVRALRDVMGEVPTAEIATWRLTSYKYVAPANCGTDPAVVQGFISSNAIAVDSRPPLFDIGFFRYMVESFHLNSDREVAKGSFKFVMNSDVARCHYGFNSAPIYAEIQVISEDGEQSVATTIARESDDWIQLSAENFTYSRKEFEIKLTQVSAEPKPLVRQKTLSTFIGRATTLTEPQKMQVKAAVEANPNAEKFICTGIRYFDQPMSENILVRKRAKAACGYAKQLKPSLSTWYQNKPTQARSYNGKVLLTIKSPSEKD